MFVVPLDSSFYHVRQTLQEGQESIYQHGSMNVQLLATDALYAWISMSQLFQLGQLAVKNKNLIGQIGIIVTVKLVVDAYLKLDKGPFKVIVDF